jgi:hypothetical protein
MLMKCSKIAPKAGIDARIKIKRLRIVIFTQKNNASGQKETDSHNELGESGRSWKRI